MSIDPQTVSPVRPFEIHCEPDRLSSFRIFLTQDGQRVSASSSLVPKPLREVIQSQKISSAFEREWTEFLRESRESYPIHLRTAAGAVRTEWDESEPLAARTELDLTRGRVRVQKVLVSKNQPERVIRNFVRIGEKLIGDLETGRLMPIIDHTGWYIAQRLHESIPAAAQPAASALQYEPEEDPDPDAAQFRSVLARAKDPEKDRDGVFLPTEPFELSMAAFNDRKIGFPREQRSGYLKDILLLVEGLPVESAEGRLTFRVTLSRKEAAETVRVKASALWEGQWFDFGADFFKYFEHLRYLRSADLRKRTYQKRLADAALRLLSEPSQAAAEKIIALEIERIDAPSSEARWEAAEYLKRFHRTFVAETTENLLVCKEGWRIVPLDHTVLGGMLRQVHSQFSGDLLSWLETQEREVEVRELFAGLRALHAALSAIGVQLCYRDRPVRAGGLKVRIEAKKDPEAGWFELDPRVSWDGRELTDAEWRAIVENQGIWQAEDDLWILDERTMRILESTRRLMEERMIRRKERSGTVRIPRLHLLDWVHLREWGADVRLSDEEEKLIQKLLRFERVERKDLPRHFKGELRDYQRDGYDWLAFLYEYGLGGCLADDMGLGKTVQAIAFLGGLKEGRIRREGLKNGGVHLIVMPSTLVFNWKHELQHFYPDLKVQEYGVASRRGDWGDADVILTTYDILRRDEKVFQKKRFHVVVFDEAQFMKNLSAKRTASARRLSCDFAITLTGTPLENHLGEYFSILDLSLPGLLGNYEDFKRWTQEDPLGRLKRRAYPFVLRRTKENTLKELPPKTENEVFLRMDPKQSALYRKVVSQVKSDVHKAFSQKPEAQASLSALTAILRLRQVCVSPRLLDRKAHERSPKIEYLLSNLKEIVEEGHSALVFSQFTSFLDVVEEEVRAEGLDYFRMDGTTPKARRKAMVDAFQCGAGAPVFLISLKTGGVGLNLTRASYVFHLDPWWNPAVENQASDRVHRIGQTKNVLITRLLMEHTVEERMMVLKQKKAKLYRAVLEGTQSKPSSSGLLTREDFDFLLS